MCIYALDVYDWKDLGRTEHLPARGCAGCYVSPSPGVPSLAMGTGPPHRAEIPAEQSDLIADKILMSNK
jgi:hypothetical protein